jgi:type IV pilus assembly protein PilB
MQFQDDKQDKELNDFRTQEEEDLAQILSEKYGVPYIDLSTVPINTDSLRLITEPTARERKIAVFDLAGKIVRLVTLAPASPDTILTLSDLKAQGYRPELYIGSQNSLRKAWDRYKELSYTTQSSDGLLDIASDTIADIAERPRTISEVQTLIQETLTEKRGHKTSRLVETLLASSLSLSASDIHIEPEEATVRVRMRVDGVLVEIVTLTYDSYKLLLSRIKLLSGMKLNIREDSQDGRFSIHLNELEIEIRASVLPGPYGESVVMRILNPDSINVDIGALGMSEHLLDAVTKQIKKPNGLILNTGPTGSGKTTTLYSFLKSVHKPGIKIITIEDPIEYHLDGIVQTQVDPEKGYTFAAGLRSILRQDPDIIMVGEIRDAETAETAVHAALTGHLVFTTLHTNNAAGTFARLANLNVSRSTFGASINVSMAQRLVRKLCPACREQVALTGEQKNIIEETIATIYDTSAYQDILPAQYIWQAKGCEACGGVGYKGRVGLFEAIVMNDEIEQLVRTDATEHEVERTAEAQGFLNLRQDGVIKVLRGVTDMAELERVIDLSEV